jgi:KTSC domain
MPQLQSVAIESVRYDERIRTLAVKFRAGGRVLIYENVPQHIYDSLLFADSISAYFQSRIAGVYPLREVSPRPGWRTVPPGSAKEPKLERASETSARNAKKTHRI